MSEFNLSDKICSAEFKDGFILEDIKVKYVKEFIKRLKQYTNEGWNNPDKKNMINKIDKLSGKDLI